MGSRHERQRIVLVRGIVERRDGYCRIGKNLLAAMGPCLGPSQWAHLEQYKRFKTRKMKPELRHTTGGTCMLCLFHHAVYDLKVNEHRLQIEFLTEREADGPMAFTLDGRRFEESSNEITTTSPDSDPGPGEHGVGVRGADEAQPDARPEDDGCVWFHDPFGRRR